MIELRERSRRFVLVPEKPDQPPEGRLIAAALERTNPKLTQRKAAELADISEARWRQLVSGYISVGQGNYAAVHAPAKTLARMADVVGVTPEELNAADRSDAAVELMQLQRNRSAHFPVGSEGDPLDLTRLSPAEIELVKAVIRAMREGRGDD